MKTQKELDFAIQQAWADAHGFLGLDGPAGKTPAGKEVSYDELSTSALDVCAALLWFRGDSPDEIEEVFGKPMLGVVESLDCALSLNKRRRPFSKN